MKFYRAFIIIFFGSQIVFFKTLILERTFFDIFNSSIKMLRNLLNKDEAYYL
jgi:hypothetical protein